MTLRGSGWVTTRATRAPQHEGSRASDSPSPATPAHPEQHPWAARGVYCHGNWRPVKLVEVGAVCSCCGTLIPWYVR